MMISSLLIFVSCTKEEDFLKNPSVQNSKVNVNLKTVGSNLRVWYDNGGDDYGCTGIGGSCLPDVIITPEAFAQIIPIFKSIQTDDSKEISETFLAEKDFLLKFFDENLI